MSGMHLLQVGAHLHHLLVLVMPKNVRVMMMRVVVMVSMCYEVVLSFCPTHNEHIEVSSRHLSIKCADQMIGLQESESMEPMTRQSRRYEQGRTLAAR